MNGIIKARIFRFDPAEDDEPWYKNYTFAAEEPLSVLVLLNHIQQEKDPTLGFRSYCCGLQMCKSCLMRINGKKRFACITLVRPGEDVLLEPAEFPNNHIKDLITRLEE